MTGLKTLSMNLVWAYYSRNTLLPDIIDEKIHAQAWYIVKNGILMKKAFEALLLDF
jgi:hypothetical protein